jgi:integrase
MYRIKVDRFKGVYYRKSSKRNHRGRPDKCFDISYKDSNGRLVWEKAGWASEGYTAQMASQVRSERLRTLRHGRELPQKKDQRTLQGIWDNEYKAEKSEKKSFRDDCFRYNKHIKPVFGTKPLSAITTARLNQFKNNLLNKKGLSAQTVVHILNLIKSAINIARRNKLFDGDNPVSGVKYPSTKNTNRLRYLERDEARRLLDKLKDTTQTHYEMAYLSLYTGMRADEIFSLRWQDIDLKNNVIHILDTKNTEARTAYMTAGVKEILKNKKEGLPYHFVFPQEIQHNTVKKIRGNIKKNKIGGSYRQAVKRLGLNDNVEDDRYKVVFHTLRHTFGSWLAIRGESLQTIKELMGHRRISQTERYAHLSPDIKKQAVEALHED